MNRAKAMGGAVLVAAAAAVGIAPGVAYADPPPSNCESGFVLNLEGTWATCKTGSGYVRAIAVCINQSGKTTTGLGAWAPVGKHSYAYCPDSHTTLVDHTYRIKTY